MTTDSKVVELTGDEITIKERTPLQVVLMRFRKHRLGHDCSGRHDLASSWLPSLPPNWRILASRRSRWVIICSLLGRSM